MQMEIKAKKKIFQLPKLQGLILSTSYRTHVVPNLSSKRLLMRWGRAEAQFLLNFGHLECFHQGINA